MDDITNGLIETEEDLEQARVLDDQERLARLESFRLKAADEFDEPDYTVEQNGIGFAPRGNIMALMAEMKHGKTFVNMTLAAAVLKGEFMGIKGKLENAKVVFFDTEQDKADGQRIMRRVHYVNGWDFKIDNPRFQVYHLREIDFTKRRQLIHDVIDVYRPDVVFIDGIRDLLQDFNSLEESADLIQDLMTTSSTYKCAIWTVLHVNPNSDKMRGHLGTELGNKVTDVFKVTKKKEGGCITFEVEHQAARHRDVDGWTFRINDDKPYGIPELVGEEEKAEIGNSEKNEMQRIYKSILGLGIKKKCDVVLELMGMTGKCKSSCYENIGKAINLGVIEKVDSHIGEVLRFINSEEVKPF